MKTKWETKKLGDVDSIIFLRGNGLSKSMIKADGKNNCIHYGELYTIYQEPIIKNVISKTDFDGKIISEKGDLLIPGTTTADAWGIAISRSLNEKGVVLGGDINILRTGNKQLLSDFLSYFINGPAKFELASYATGTNIMHLSNKKIKNIEVPIPPLPTQKAIVKILDETFESLKKAKETSEKNLLNAKELFESYLESVKGEKINLDEFVDIKTGKLDSNAAEIDGKYPFFTCSRKTFAINSYAFDCEAILLAGNNASGDFNVKHYRGKFNAYQRTYVITIKDTKKLDYRFLYFQMLKGLKELKKSSIGTATKFLKIGMIKNFKIPKINLTEQKAIVSKLDTLSKEIKDLEAIYKQKLEDIEELKKAILKKAFSGELVK